MAYPVRRRCATALLDGCPMKKSVGVVASCMVRAAIVRLSMRGFIADRHGGTAVEFAMIAVPLFGLISAIFENGMVYYNNAQLQTVTEIASRALLTNNGTAGQTYQDFVDKNVCTWQKTGVVTKGTLSTSFDCSKVMVDIRSPATWSAADATNDFYASAPARTAVISLPAAGQIAVVRIAYPMPVLATILTGGIFTGQTISRSTAGQVQFNGASSHILLGAYAFRVEPAGS
jgi:Flp pilus assembly protein TadG